MDNQINVASLGWGVQSTTIAVMQALGDLPKCDYVIHADTLHEAKATYEYAAMMWEWLDNRGVTVVKVANSDRRIGDLDNNVTIPAHTTRLNGQKSGLLRRQCTDRWKIRPIRQYLSKELDRLGRKKSPGTIRMWLGITTDEIQRIKDSDVQHIVNHYPLIDKGMSRRDCVAYLESHGLPVPPKSACVFCPYQSKSRWQALQRRGGSDWEAAVKVDEAMRYRRPNFVSYVHPLRIPLRELPVNGYMFDDLSESSCDSGYCFS